MIHRIEIAPTNVRWLYPAVRLTLVPQPTSDEDRGRHSRSVRVALWKMGAPDIVRDHSLNRRQRDGDHDQIVNLAEDRNEIGDQVDRAGDVERERHEQPAGEARRPRIERDPAQSTGQA